MKSDLQEGRDLRTEQVSVFVYFVRTGGKESHISLVEEEEAGLYRPETKRRKWAVKTLLSFTSPSAVEKNWLSVLSFSLGPRERQGPASQLGPLSEHGTEC